MCTSQRAMSYWLYKHRSRSTNVSITIESIQLFFILVFTLTFYFPFLFRRLDLLATASTPWIAMVHTSPPSRRHLARGGAPRQRPVAPLTVISPDKTGSSDLPNRCIQFLQFRAEASGLCSFHVATWIICYRTSPVASSPQIRGGAGLRQQL
jgi:hypothetical protein